MLGVLFSMYTRKHQSRQYYMREKKNPFGTIIPRPPMPLNKKRKNLLPWRWLPKLERGDTWL